MSQVLRETPHSARLGARICLALVIVIGTIVVWQAPSHAAAPELVAGNPDCADYGLLELKIDNQPENKTYTQGASSVTISNYDPDDENDQSFDWSSNFGVDKVIVKGGNSAHVYSYDEATSDTGLVPPTNPNNAQPFQVSHVSFCYDEGAAGGTPAPTPTEIVGPAGGASPTPTPSEAPTGEIEEEAAAEGADESVSGTAESAAGDEEVLGGARIFRRGAEAETEGAAEVLPRTGVPISMFGLLAAALLTAGSLLVRLAGARRRRAR